MFKISQRAGIRTISLGVLFYNTKCTINNIIMMPSTCYYYDVLDPVRKVSFVRYVQEGLGIVALGPAGFENIGRTRHDTEILPQTERYLVQHLPHVLHGVVHIELCNMNSRYM